MSIITGKSPLASVAERPIALPPNTRRERAVSNRRLLKILAGFVAELASARDDMRNHISDSRKTIVESQELMAQVNVMLERDKIIGRRNDGH